MTGEACPALRFTSLVILVARKLLYMLFNPVYFVEVDHGR
jgi:hypothetical protein